MDETGFRVGGKTQGLPVACTPLTTFTRVCARRGRLLANVVGVVVHDHGKPCYAMEGARHALCDAHHLRELKALVEIEKAERDQAVRHVAQKPTRLWVGIKPVRLETGREGHDHARTVLDFRSSPSAAKVRQLSRQARNTWSCKRTRRGAGFRFAAEGGASTPYRFGKRGPQAAVSAVHSTASRAGGVFSLRSV